MTSLLHPLAEFHERPGEGEEPEAQSDVERVHQDDHGLSLQADFATSAVKSSLRQAPASSLRRQCSASSHISRVELTHGVLATAPPNNAPALPSGADEHRHWARAEHGAGHRPREEVTQRMLAVRSQDEQARPPALHLLEQDLRGGGGRTHRVYAVDDTVRSEEVAGGARDRARLGRVAVNGHDGEGLAGGEPQQREQLERAGGFAAAAVRDADAGALRQRLRNDDHRTRAAPHYLREGGVTALRGPE